jgi:hypothetical protein
MVVDQVAVQKDYPLSSLPIQCNGAPLSKSFFLGDGEHPLAFSVDSFDIVLMPVKGFEHTSR